MGKYICTHPSTSSASCYLISCLLFIQPLSFPCEQLSLASIAISPVVYTDAHYCCYCQIEVLHWNICPCLVDLFFLHSFLSVYLYRELLRRRTLNQRWNVVYCIKWMGGFPSQLYKHWFQREIQCGPLHSPLHLETMITKQYTGIL